VKQRPLVVGLMLPKTEWQRARFGSGDAGTLAEILRGYVRARSRSKPGKVR
jgi:hypothetical protein